MRTRTLRVLPDPPVRAAVLAAMIGALPNVAPGITFHPQERANGRTIVVNHRDHGYAVSYRTHGTGGRTPDHYATPQEAAQAVDDGQAWLNG
jgi:hypothetical protein